MLSHVGHFLDHSWQLFCLRGTELFFSTYSVDGWRSNGFTRYVESVKVIQIDRIQTVSEDLLGFLNELSIHDLALLINVKSVSQ